MQKIISKDSMEKKEIYQKCLKPVFQTLRLGDAYFLRSQAMNCRDFALRKKAEREAVQALGDDPDRKPVMEE